MSVHDMIQKKLQQATCDKPEWNRKVLRWRKSFKEIEKVLKGDCRKHDHKGHDHKEHDHGKHDHEKK